MLRVRLSAVRDALVRPELWAALSALLVAYGLRRGFGRYDSHSLAVVTLGTLAALVALVAARRWPSPDLARVGAPPASGAAASRLAPTDVLLAAGAFWFAAGDAFAEVAPHLSAPWVTSIAALVVALVAASYLVAAPGWVRRTRFAVAVALFLAAGASVLLARAPRIDVWTLQQQAAAAMLAGRNPYAIEYPNPYPDGTWFGPGLLDHGRIVSFPYPPATIAWDVPFFAALGDVRFGMLVAAALAALGLRRLGGRRGELAALVLLWQPTTFFVLSESWTEPTVVAAWVLALVALGGPASAAPASARRAWTSGLALGLVAVTKQYTPLLLLPLAFAVPPRHLGRILAAGAAVVALLVLPFAVWDARELVRDLVGMQLAQPFRIDALSLTAWWARHRGSTPPASLGFVAAAGVLGAAVRPRIHLGRAVLVAAAAFLLFVLLAKQAFCNYYWLGTGLLLTAVALRDTEALGRRGQVA